MTAICRVFLHRWVKMPRTPWLVIVVVVIVVVVVVVAVVVVVVVVVVMPQSEIRETPLCKWGSNQAGGKLCLFCWGGSCTKRAPAIPQRPKTLEIIKLGLRPHTKRTRPIYIYIYMYIYIYAYIYIYIYAHMHIHMLICASFSLSLSIYIYMHLSMHGCNCLFIYLSIYPSIYLSIYLYIYIAIQLYTRRLPGVWPTGSIGLDIGRAHEGAGLLMIWIYNTNHTSRGMFISGESQKAMITQ